MNRNDVATVGIIAVVIIAILGLFNVYMIKKRTAINECVAITGSVQTCKCAHSYCREGHISSILMTQIIRDQQEVADIQAWNLNMFLQREAPQ